MANRLVVGSYYVNELVLPTSREGIIRKLCSQNITDIEVMKITSHEIILLMKQV